MIPDAGQYDRDIEQVSIDDIDPQEDVKIDRYDYGRKYSNSQDCQLIRATRASKETDVYKNPSSPIFLLLILLFLYYIE
jgi:hypothetical protein